MADSGIEFRHVLSAAALAARSDGPSSLETNHNVVTAGLQHILKPCGCSSWYCPQCCESKGYALRARLIEVIGSFRALMMVTLTIDPLLFARPLDAMLWLRERRAISRTVQDLRRWGYLNTRRYFCVVEFQAQTAFPHFHILLDTAYIPHDRLTDAWSKQRPPDAGPPPAGRPPFGFCFFSAPRFASPLHAARYATKYLVKTPLHGFPAWVMGLGKDIRVPRYSVSRGFWNSQPKPARVRSKQPRQRSTPRTYAERVAVCGDSTNVFQLVDRISTSTGLVVPALRFRGRLDVPFKSVPSTGEKTRKIVLQTPTLRGVQEWLEQVSGYTPRFIVGPFGGGAA